MVSQRRRGVFFCFRPGPSTRQDISTLVITHPKLSRRSQAARGARQEGRPERAGAISKTASVNEECEEPDRITMFLGALCPRWRYPYSRPLLTGPRGRVKPPCHRKFTCQSHADEKELIHPLDLFHRTLPAKGPAARKPRIGHVLSGAGEAN